MITILHPQTGEKIRVANKDFSGKMCREDAIRACSELGPGWRLPFKDELNEIYLNKYAIGGFSDSYYWSASISNENECWLQDFENGDQYCGYANSGMVRAVCNI